MQRSALLLLQSQGQPPRGHQGTETEGPADLSGTEIGRCQGTEVGESQRAVDLAGTETEEQRLTNPETPAEEAQTEADINTIIWCTSAAPTETALTKTARTMRATWNASPLSRG